MGIKEDHENAIEEEEFKTQDEVPPGCYSGGEEELQQENLSTQAKFNPLGRAEFDCGWPSTVQCSF